MPRSARSSSPEVNDPATLPESTRDYYRSTWGFDPVADCRILGSGRFQYEECLPLPEDLPLQAIGITICAHVDWEGEDVRNRIVFRRSDAEGRQKEASVECTHTIIFAGPTSDALTFADNLDTIDPSPENLTPIAKETLYRAERPATLPPWENFPALKSYVAAVADMGVITLLGQSFTVTAAAPADTAGGLPFGFNAVMHAQVLGALYTIAPFAMISIYRDLTCEFLDSHPPAAPIDQWYAQSEIFAPSEETLIETDLKTTVENPDWGLLLRHLGTPTLVYWFRHTKIADNFQDRLFTEDLLLARARAIAPDLPWETLRNEWKARREAEDLGCITSDHRGRGVTHFPPAEVWARTPFCDYTYPRILLSPDSTSSRRSRVQAYLREMTQVYAEGLADELTDNYLDWAARVSSDLDAVVMAPFRADRVRPLPIHHYNHTLKYNEILPPAGVVDSIEHGNHKRRRAVVLSYSLTPELQVKIANHWDFATRLALISNPGTNAAVLKTLAQDPQPCVRLAAAARVRRGTATFEPLFGEILDPGEMVWLLSSHPGVVFQFCVTTWGDGSDAYRDWFTARLRENKEQYEDWTTARFREKKERQQVYFETSMRKHLFGELYGWAYSEGVFLEEDERGYHGSHLAYYGLTEYACGQFPCLYLGLDLFTGGGDADRLDL